MAKKQVPNEREYIIPLRREILKVPRHKRTPKAVKAIKKFLAKHMRVPERDTSKIKLDKYLNQELWFRGIKNPPAKIKVKAKKEGELIKVELVELKDKLKYKKQKEEKREQEQKKVKEQKKKAQEETQKEKTEEKTEEQQKEQDEKEKSSEIAKQEKAEMQAKEQKHTSKQQKEKRQPIRKTMQK